MNFEENKENIISLIEDISPSYFNELFVPNKEKDKLLKEYQYLNGISGISSKLKINIKLGLDSLNQKDIEDRRRIYGYNKPILREHNTLFEFVLECLEDRMLRILLGAAFVSTIIGMIKEGLTTGWLEGFAIFFAVFVVVSITSLNNYNKEKQFLLLSLENQKKKVVVRRDGIDKNIEVDELVVGDILKIFIGNIISVDGIIIEGEVQIDESSLTGESDLVKKKTEAEIQRNKNDKKVITPIIFSGTSIKCGSGYMLVCAVGINSNQGKTTNLIRNQESNELTPLQEKLKALAEKIGDFGLISAILIGFSIFLKELLIRIYLGQRIFSSELIDTLINSFIMAVAVIVVAIPEGLPLAVAISLAYSVMKLKEENNLVRHLDSAETMGGVQHICSDKTGTLTNGVMTLKQVFLENVNTNFKSLDKGTISETEKMLYKAILNNKEATIEINKDNRNVVTGNMTDIALINAISSRIDINNYYEYLDGECKENINVKTLPFNSDYKMMAKLYRKDNNSYKLYIKGAPERLYDRVLNYMSEEGKLSLFTKNVLNKFREVQNDYAEQSMRTLLILHSNDLTEKEFNQITEQSFENWEKHLNNLAIIGMIGISDTKRDNVEESIKILTEKSGINVKMVTGDNILTAIAISKDVGILDEKEYKKALLKIKAKEKLDKIIEEIKEFELKLKITVIDRNEAGNLRKEYESKLNERANLINTLKFENNDEIVAIEGEEFQRLTGGFKLKKIKNLFQSKEGEVENQHKQYILVNEKNFRDVVKNLKIIARASPQDKFLLVLGLKQIGNVVAVTGDGTNDAPALRAADVGFAMGKRGTDICKESSDIIILNDSFESIVTAVKYGRNVYNCIRKFLQFQLTSNVVAVLMTFIGGIYLRDAPLNAIQMLWVNLIMDSFGSLALATEPPNDNVLNRKPYSRNENIITKTMYLNIMTQSLFQIIILCIILAYGDNLFGVPSDRNLLHYQWNNINGYHFTIFFNIFVFMQVFNSINARKLNKSELNIFVDITNNPLYIFVQIAIVIGQLLMVTFGGRPIRTHPLSIMQHIYCILIASLCLPFGILIKYLPFEDYEAENDDQQISDNKQIGEALYKKVIGKRGSIVRTSNLSSQSNKVK